MSETNTNDTTPSTKRTTKDEHNVAYPDISKASTKNVVILSIICIVLIFLLSVFFPDNTKVSNISSQQTTLFENVEKTSTNMEVFSFHPLSPASPGFQTIHNATYYLVKYSTCYTGWLTLDNKTYYFDTDGVMSVGWNEIAGNDYYFNSNGILLKNQWVEDRYVGENGYVLRNTLTPNNVYVNDNGYADNALGTANSTNGLTELKSILEDMIAGYSGTWSVYVKDIKANEYLSIHNEQHFSASLIKLYCAACSYDLINKSILEETPYLSSLMSQMISISDNDAFNLMVMACAPDNQHITGRQIIQDYLYQEGYKDTTITSILVPTKYKAPSSPGRNLTTVEDCGLLLEKIYKRQCVNAYYSDKLLELLLNQTHLNKIPAGLPEGTKCANKTGDTDEVQHDAAIVYSPATDYIICVMSSDCPSAIPNIQDISRTVYDYFN